MGGGGGDLAVWVGGIGALVRPDICRLHRGDCGRRAETEYHHERAHPHHVLESQLQKLFDVDV